MSDVTGQSCGPRANGTCRSDKSVVAVRSPPPEIRRVGRRDIAPTPSGAEEVEPLATVGIALLAWLLVGWDGVVMAKLSIGKPPPVPEHSNRDQKQADEDEGCGPSEAVQLTRLGCLLAGLTGHATTLPRVAPQQQSS